MNLDNLYLKYFIVLKTAWSSLKLLSFITKHLMFISFAFMVTNLHKEWSRTWCWETAFINVPKFWIFVKQKKICKHIWKDLIVVWFNSSFCCKVERDLGTSLTVINIWKEWVRYPCLKLIKRLYQLIPRERCCK